MNIIKTRCPSCGNPLEFPRDFDNVICPGCETPYRVREYKGAISLSAITQQADGVGPRVAGTNGARELGAVEVKLAELDEVIQRMNEEIEAIRSKEQAAPLQAGCAFFGVFGLVLLVIALFMVLKKDYIGGWLFYLSIAAVIAAGVLRARRKLANSTHLDRLREERLLLEADLAQVEVERRKAQELKESIVSKNTNFAPDENGG